MDSPISLILSNLPDKPGVYQFLDSTEEIIYIGKAINLKKRVSSYFHKNHADNRKLWLLVKKIVNINYIIVNSEQDALLLENNLIKRYQPRYNFLLKDDKTFPWICFKNEPFPRVFSTRNIVKDGSQYFGPYTSGMMVRTLLDLIRQLFPIRSCALNLSESQIRLKKYKICLEFHLGNCLGPCEGRMTSNDYLNNILRIKDILKGNLSHVTSYLKELMQNYSEEFKFEEANIVKNKIVILTKFQSKSTIVNPSIQNVDVFSIFKDGDLAAVNYLKVVDGAILMAHTVEINLKIDEDAEDILLFSILELRNRFISDSPELIVPYQFSTELPGVLFTCPKIGDKRKLLELSERNAKFFLLNLKKQRNQKYQEKPANKILERIQHDLHLNELPIFIECFDNSNIQGTNPVAACVVFKNAKPLKSEYRHFNIKTVEGPDDFSSMKEIVYRRYKRQLEESKPLPQLIIIDGGKGQLGVAVEVLRELNLFDKIAIIGIAKRLEEIYFPGDSLPIYLEKSSVTLRIIQQLRDEAHRFGINFHRNKRSNSMINSQLDSIPGVGEKTVSVLLNKYKSINGLKNSKFEDLIELIGEKKAIIIWNYISNS